MAGKEILIKSIEQAIPTYAMACFDLKKSFCNQVRAMVSRYWWCSHKNLIAHVDQSKALSRKARPIAFLFKATKMSETTK
jgi:hypothetical protein